MDVIRPRRHVGVLLIALVLGWTGLVEVPSTAGAGIGPAGRADTVVLHGQALTLDGGALRVRPTAVATHLPIAQARFDLTHSSAGGAGFSTGRILYGAVTVTAHREVDPNSPGRYPTFQSTPAWVLFFDPGASSCPATALTPSSAKRAGHSARRNGVPLPRGNRPDRSAMVINARTGAALIYLGIGAGTCTAVRRPEVTKVAELVSVPWTIGPLPSGTAVAGVTADYPGCSASFTAGGESRPGTLSLLGVEVLRAFGPCCLAGRELPVSIAGFHFVAPLRHVPVGPIRTGQPAF
jgi:hypothetical protein